MTQPSARGGARLRLWRHVLVPATWAATAIVGLQFRSYGMPVTSLWPPAGVAFAATFAWGPSALPGVLLAATSINLMFVPWDSGLGPLVLAALIGVGNAAAAQIAAGVARQAGLDPRLTHLRDVATLSAAAAAGATASALVGSSALSLLHGLSAAETTRVALVWWLGDHLGIVTFGPLLLNHRPDQDRSSALLPLAVLLCLASFLALDPFDLHRVIDASWLTLVPLVWLGIRAGPDMIPIGLITLEASFLIATQAGLGPLARSHRDEPYVALAVFLVLAAATAQVAGALAWRLRTTLDDAVRGSAHFMQLIASFPAGAVFAGADGRLLINQAAEQLTGSPVDRTTRWSSWIDQVFVDPAAFRALRPPEDGGVVRGLLQVRGPRGVRAALVAGTRLEHGELWLMADDTVRQEREDELRGAKEAAEAGLRARSDFLATMSHEVRTPLNGVIGLAQALRHSRLDQHQRAWLDALEVSAQSLLHLLNDMLELSRSDAGQIAPRLAPFSPRRLAEEVVTVHQPEAAERHLRLRVESVQLPPAVLSDAGLLRQILLNLVGNAIKFTEEGGVTVHVRHEDGRLRYEVEDTGVGIPPDLGERMFEPFARGDHTASARHGGAGLGLPISRRFARLLGGDVWYRSGEAGAVFVVDVPAVATEAPEPPVFDGAGKVTARVLVAEDNPINRTVVRALLQQLGVDCVIVHDGEAALDAASREQFDLILMDCRMPGRDGYSATRALRARGNRTPIVALTASNSAMDREATAAAGMDDHLAKPITLPAIRAVLARWVTRPTASTTP